MSLEILNGITNVLRTSRVELEQVGYVVDPFIGPLFPIVTLPSRGKRGDVSGISVDQYHSKLLTESQVSNLPTYITDDVTVCLTDNPAPHLPADRKYPEEPNHLICWFWKRGLRQTILDMTHSKDTDQKPLIKGIEDILTRGISLLSEKHHLLEEEKLQNIKIFGLTGHAFDYLRKSGMSPSRGAQSSPDGHINLELKRRQDLIKATTIERVQPRSYIKSIDPLSTVLTRRYANEILQTVQPFLGISDVVTIEEDHEYVNSPGEDQHVRVSEFLKVQFTKPVPFSEGFKKFLDVMGVVNHSYETLFYFFESQFADVTPPWKVVENPLTQKVRDDLSEFPPTLGQIKYLLRAHREKTLHLKKEKIGYLERLQEKYQQRKKQFENPIFRTKIYGLLMKRYDITVYEARTIVSSYFSDLVADPTDAERWKTIEFAFSRYFSSSYLLDWTLDGKGGLLLRGFTISPKLATAKGGAEDINGAILKRGVRH